MEFPQTVPNVSAPARLSCGIWALFLLAAAVFLYLQLFVLPCTPIFLPNDSLIFLRDARAMRQGQILYRDIAQFTFPGTQAVYAALMVCVGPRVWLPNAVLVMLGTLMAALTTLVAQKVLIGSPNSHNRSGNYRVFLPAFLLLTLEFSAWHIATHHWFSAAAAAGAILVVLENRAPRRLAAAGALCGVCAWFTQTEGAFLLMGFVAFVLWESRKQGWKTVAKRWGLLLAGFAVVLIAGLTYFVAKAGLAQFIWSTFVFPARYFPTWTANNSYRTYAADLVGLRAWEVVPLLFVMALVPWVYVFFMLAYRRRHAAGGERWVPMTLLSITGFCLFVSVAPAPGWFRLCTVSAPAWVVLVWLLSHSRAARWALTALWVLGIASAATVLLKTARREHRLRADLQLPTGRAAFLDSGAYDEFKYLSSHTGPGDYFFGGRIPHFYFPLELRTPSPVPNVITNDYTRPGDVAALIEGLKRHRVRYVLWQLELDTPSPYDSAGDHLPPLRAFLRAHYRVVKVFPGSNDQLWERQR